MNIIDGLCYDDVLLIPQHSEIESRADISVEIDLGKGIRLSGPFISANMKTVTGPRLASEMYPYGMGVLHRFDTVQNQIKNYKDTINSRLIIENTVGISVGINDVKETEALISGTGTKIVCVDVAHGDHGKAIGMVSWIHAAFPKVLLIAGNVATGAGAKRLAAAGADVIKVGIGPGSLCTTRVETAAGVPQLTALEDVYKTLCADQRNIPGRTRPRIIADGGIKASGDVVKALCFADAVMLGSILAGTDEAPGEVVNLEDKEYKQYAGSSTHKTNRIEGVAGLIPCKGPMSEILERFKEGLQSGLSYQGCDNLVDLKESPQFVRISSAGLMESHPHANLK